jgi:hypothetical protein
MASVPAIRVRDSRNWRTGAGAHSMIDAPPKSLKTLQAIGEKDTPAIVLGTVT